MRRLSFRLSLALFVLSVGALPLAAQRAPKIDVAIVPANALVEGPAITSVGLLADPKTREHLRNGFPTRLHYRLDLWRKGGVFDDPVGRTEWDVLVRYEPTSNSYVVQRRSSDSQVLENFGGFESVTSADAQLAKPFKTALHPNRSGKYYYDLVVDVQTLAESDLDAALQWMRGTTTPGKNSNPLTLLGSGLETLVSRVLGGSTKSYRQPTGIFTVE